MQPAELIQTLQSVVSIPVTPFGADGEIDDEAYRLLIRRLVDNGVDVITPNGNTGEFYALSPDECRRTLRMALDVAGDRACIIAGVGFDIASAVDMGGLAAEMGAQAIMVHQPIHPFQSAAGWIAYHQAIADALPTMGVVPYIRDAAISSSMLQQLIAACPNVVGVKYAVPNALQFARLVHDIGPERLAWICGLAEVWAPFFWIAGARGFTSGLANVWPALSLNLFDRLARGDYAAAMAIWAKLKPFEELRAEHNNANNVSVVKEALAQQGLCARTVRPPITELVPSDRARVEDILTSWHSADASGI